MVCDYTAFQMSWAPGPKAKSMEGIYPFTTADGQVLHTIGGIPGYTEKVVDQHGLGDGPGALRCK
jgi:hypothetical protein